MITRAFKFALVLFFTTFLFGQSVAQEYRPEWSSLNQRKTPEWWSDAKFGIFVHWGLYSVPAYAPVDEVEGVYAKYAEHYYMRLLEGDKLFTDYHKKHYGEDFSYEDFVPLFKAEHFDPDKWAALFKKSGAGYVVLTSKHHDGYSLWPSEHSPGWNSVETGPKRDIIQELSTSVRNAGLRMGLYYSLLEWNKPLYTDNIDRWTTEHMIPQMKDMVNRYKPEVIFSDGEWDYTSKELKSEEFLAWLYNESPVKNSVVVNDRWGKETRSKHGGYYTTEYDLIGDEVNTEAIQHAWEESRGIGTSYGYNKFERVEHYFSSKQLIELLVDKVSNGGNLLLNVGPKANGLIPVIMEQRLLDIGEWLEVNGEAIYGTTAWSKRPDNMSETGVYYTLKGNDLYVICTEWPQDNLIIDGVKDASNVSLVGSPQKVKFKTSKGKLTITPPTINPGNAPSKHAWVFKLKDFK